MAKIVLVCLRNPASEPAIQMRRRMHAFLASLCPDNLKPVQPSIATDLKGLWLGVYNPAEERSIHECSAYAGWLAEPKSRWWRIGEPAPSGTYGVFRGGRSAVEILADHAGSRAIWTAMTDKVFIASTTQRAIPYFLRSFEPNPEAQAWMLSSGTLGPKGGWDRRTMRIAPAGSVRLDRTHWRLATHEPTPDFTVDDSTDDALAERLTNTLQDTLGNLDLDFSRWVLPLSGGYDSRAILLMMKNRGSVRTVTWGSANSRHRRGNDAQIAPRVAAELGVTNEYFETDLSGESIDKIMRRFVIAGDACTDGFNAYLDGFRVWRQLFDSGIRGIIRGDQVFGLTPGPAPRSAAEVRAGVGITPWSDLVGAPSLADLGLAHLDRQSIPQSYVRRSGESHSTWRDRLFQAFRIPVYMAGQHELKATYVEIANPLITRDLLTIARTQPQRLRSGKQLLQRVIAPHDIDVDYAIESALVAPCDFTQLPKVRTWLRDQLTSRLVRRTFTGKFADSLNESLTTVSEHSPVAKIGKRVRQHARMLLPDQVRAWVPRDPKRAVFDAKAVAVRAWLAAAMLDRLASDARRGARGHLESLPSVLSAAG